MSEVVTIRLTLPNALPTEAVGEALRACLDHLGLVQGHALYDKARTLHVTAHWASEAKPQHHLCAEPGCRSYPAVRLDGREWCGRHGAERQRAVSADQSHAQATPSRPGPFRSLGIDQADKQGVP